MNPPEKFEKEVDEIMDRIEDDEAFLERCRQIKEFTAKHTECGILCFVIFCLLLCGVFFVVCPKCIFGILILSACLCPFFNAMNAPLWLAIILLTVSGWSFSTRALSISWTGS